MKEAAPDFQENKCGEGSRGALFHHALVFVLLLLVVTVGRYHVKNITDDALITYRYSVNLVEGMGFVYNEGERVLGTTTPLYALVIAFFYAVGVVPWVASLVIEALSITVMLFLLSLWVLRDLGRSFQVAFLLFCLHNPVHYLTMAGMETAFFALLIVVALYCMTRGHLKCGITAAALLPWVRPEGVVVALLVGLLLVNAWRRERASIPWRYLVGAAVVTLGVIVVLTWYFGSPIPQSVVAKRAQGEVIPLMETFPMAYLHGQWHPHLYYFSLWLPLQLLGLVWILLRPGIRWLGIWYLACMGFLLLGKAPVYGWYADQLMPARLVMLASGAMALVHLGCRIVFRAPGWMKNQVLHGAAAFLVLLALAPGFSRAYFQVYIHVLGIDEAALDGDLYHPAGLWLRHNTDPADVVFVPEIGYIGYLSGRRIYDPLGIISPEALEHFGTLTHTEHAVMRGTEWVVFSHDHYRFGKWELPVAFASVYHPVAGWWDERRHAVVFGHRDHGEGNRVPLVSGEHVIMLHEADPVALYNPPGSVDGSHTWVFNMEENFISLELHLAPSNTVALGLVYQAADKVVELIITTDSDGRASLDIDEQDFPTTVEITLSADAVQGEDTPHLAVWGIIKP